MNICQITQDEVLYLMQNVVRDSNAMAILKNHMTNKSRLIWVDAIIESKYKGLVFIDFRDFNDKFSKIWQKEFPNKDLPVPATTRKFLMGKGRLDYDSQTCEIRY